MNYNVSVVYKPRLLTEVFNVEIVDYNH